MNAALLMAKTTSLLRCLAKTSKDPAELLTKVNREICETASLGMFVTIVAGYLYPQRGLVELSNAGHQPPLFLSRDGGYEELPASAPPIGILAETSFASQCVPLDGGCIYLFTDGVTESRAADGSELGVAGLRDLIEVSSAGGGSRLENIVAGITAQKRTVHDDLRSC